MTGLDDVYRQRFPEVSRRQKDMIWPEITRYLEQWIDPSAPVLDIACDSGYFIRNVRAADRWAADLRDVRSELPGRRPLRPGERSRSRDSTCRSARSGPSS